LSPARIPRYVRVNTTLWTTEEAIQFYESRGFLISGPFESRCEAYLLPYPSLLTLLRSKGFARDEHIPDLLLFPPQCQFHDDPSYKTGKIILQDKASCFPAIVLSPPAEDDSVVIDATAAPGNKTSHLSMLMCNKGKVCRLTASSSRI
jgi:putative methyltransferase